MKKIKKSIVKIKQPQLKLFKPDVKSSRLTIDSRVCNVDKFNQFLALIDNTKNYKNIISQYCYDNILSLVSDYSNFLINYKFLDNSQLNSWERQTIFQEIAGHYSETATRYLDKAKFIVIKPKSNINNIALFINSQSNLIVNNNVYSLDFNIEDKLIQLNTYLDKYNLDLSHHKYLLVNIEQDKTKDIENINKEISKLEKLIKSYNKLIANYHKVQQLKIDKPVIYNRLIKLIIDKKLRLISKVRLAIYQTGTHARHLNNAQLSIVKDLSNNKFKYFIKVRKLDKLISREPKLNNKNKNHYQELLDKYNEDNFIYLPLIFNKSRLKSIGKTIDNVLIKDNPQILIKSEQLRMGSKSRKIHIIFNYEQQNNLAKVIENNLLNKTNINPTELNTLGCDLNLKHNLIADSNGHTYKDILNNKNKFINNLNEIVELFSIKTEERTVKQKYRYEKLLRSNESLLKTYLSGLIKDWKSKDILHLVFEDLNILNDKSYYEHKGIKIKYSRLSRLLRLGQIKHWVASMAEKQGLFTHFINPAYTSQECSVCHYISTTNRTKQEEFTCRNPACANHKVKINADINAARVIKSRLLNKNLRVKLSKDNVYQCSRTKSINYKLVKNIVEDEYKIGVVTELLPNLHSRLKSKEDSVRNHTEAPSFRSV